MVCAQGASATVQTAVLLTAAVVCFSRVLSGAHFIHDVRAVVHRVVPCRATSRVAPACHVALTNRHVGVPTQVVGGAMLSTALVVAWRSSDWWLWSAPVHLAVFTLCVAVASRIRSDAHPACIQLTLVKEAIEASGLSLGAAAVRWVYGWAAAADVPVARASARHWLVGVACVAAVSHAGGVLRKKRVLEDGSAPKSVVAVFVLLLSLLHITVTALVPFVFPTWF